MNNISNTTIEDAIKRLTPKPDPELKNNLQEVLSFRAQSMPQKSNKLIFSFGAKLTFTVFLSFFFLLATVIVIAQPASAKEFIQALEQCTLSINCYQQWSETQNQYGQEIEFVEERSLDNNDLLSKGASLEGDPMYEEILIDLGAKLISDENGVKTYKMPITNHLTFYDSSEHTLNTSQLDILEVSAIEELIWGDVFSDDERLTSYFFRLDNIGITYEQYDTESILTAAGAEFVEEFDGGLYYKWDTNYRIEFIPDTNLISLTDTRIIATNPMLRTDSTKFIELIDSLKLVSNY
ncbi:hypothetical protein KC909_03920 [Candidatus Dojkabacteria bacterium]|uniref:Uncharacterized protein n=1 Tax=Candidatus Dojkabacteria bacterium TaxID=2099670 RepID=A0A955RJ70_9BACT|nr:hypothetical protein [Candidatus Dojkabacteria bacterium]